MSDAGAVATILVPVLAFFGKLIWDTRTRDVARIDKVEGKLEECTEEHTKAREEIGGLQASIKILAQSHPSSVRQQVQQQLCAAEVKAAERKTTPPTNNA